MITTIITAIGLGISIYIWYTGIERTISPFLAAVTSTVLSTILVQTLFKKRERKEKAGETMRKEVYGPLFEEISVISNVLEAGSVWEYTSAADRLSKIKSNHLFSSANLEIREGLSKIIRECETYDRILNAERVSLDDDIRDTVMKICKVGLKPADELVLRLSINKVMVSHIILRESVFRQINPEDFVEEEKKRFGDNVEIEFQEGACEGLNAFQSLYDAVMKRVEENQIFQDEIQRRQNLIEELKAYSEKVKSYIDIS